MQFYWIGNRMDLTHYVPQRAVWIDVQHLFSWSRPIRYAQLTLNSWIQHHNLVTWSMAFLKASVNSTLYENNLFLVHCMQWVVIFNCLSIVIIPKMEFYNSIAMTFLFPAKYFERKWLTHLWASPMIQLPPDFTCMLKNTEFPSKCNNRPMRVNGRLNHRVYAIRRSITFDFQL